MDLEIFKGAQSWVEPHSGEGPVKAEPFEERPRGGGFIPQKKNEKSYSIGTEFVTKDRTIILANPKIAIFRIKSQNCYCYLRYVNCWL